MLYLDSFENTKDDRTERKFAICAICPSMPNIMELVPSKELLAQWQSQEISWEEFREQFFEEMRAEYGTGEESRLRGLTEYSLENDVTLYSPEPNGEHTYRAILEEIINIIWKEEERTDRVINLARKPVEALQTEADQGQMETIPQEDEQKSELQEDFARFISEMSKTNENIESLQGMITTKDEQIQLLQAENREKDRKNDELERKIDRLEGKISNQQGKIQSLDDVIGERDRLNRKNRELEKQVNKHETTIDDLRQTLSKQQSKIQSLKDAIGKRDRDSKELETQVAQLQEIKTHPEIRNIAIKATGNDPVFEEHFRTLDIDKNLPVELRRWLEELLISVVDPLGNMGFENLDLNQAINQYSDFDRADNLLAHVIRTQGNLSVHSSIDERTEMGRALCCFFAAALLSPKLPELE